MSDTIDLPAAAAQISALTKQVKDLSDLITNPDYGLVALGLKANAAMPKAGGAFTGPVTIQTPADMSQAAQLKQLMRGVGKPAIILQNIGAIPVVDTDAVVDLSNGGRTWIITSIKAKFKTPPAVNGVLSVKTTAGSVIYTRTFLLNALPVAGDVIEFSQVVNTTLPVEVALPATIQADITSGSLLYIIIEGILKKPA